MADFGKTWQTCVAIGSGVVALAGFVQIVLSIIKSRYELRKLRADDRELQNNTKREKPEEKFLIPSHDRSDYPSERLDAELGNLVRWIILTIFVSLTGLYYVYLSVQLHKNDIRIAEKRAELAVLKEANNTLGNALEVAKALRDQLKKRKGEDKK